MEMEIYRPQDYPKPVLAKLNAPVRSRINQRAYSLCTRPASNARGSECTQHRSYLSMTIFLDGDSVCGGQVS
jgi:hypothetical protein